jgi:F0F1-type ATP synthase assembly protein I
VRRLDPKSAQALGLAWGFGWRVAAGLLLGYYLDRWLATPPLFLIVFTIGSFVVGVLEFLRISRPADPKEPEGRP